jgi:hypothetical protein
MVRGMNVAQNVLRGKGDGQLQPSHRLASASAGSKVEPDRLAGRPPEPWPGFSSLPSYSVAGRTTRVSAKLVVRARTLGADG